MPRSQTRPDKETRTPRRVNAAASVTGGVAKGLRSMGEGGKTKG